SSDVGSSDLALLPHDRHALDGHCDDHDRKQRERQPRLQTELLTQHTDRDHHQYDDRQHASEARNEEQAELFEIEADQEAERNDDRKQHDAPDQARLPKGERDENGHERPERLHTDEVAQDHDYERADGGHEQQAVDG